MDASELDPRDLERELRDCERRLDRLEAVAQSRHDDHGRLRSDWLKTRAFLELAPKGVELMEGLSKALFGEVLDEVEANLTHAIREILGQERKVKSTRELARNRLNIDFEIENQGQPEDIMAGQGGSVCNLMSVGLRLIALAQLDTARHRPFLVLDEQDCWLKPELVPKFMKLIAAICSKLGLQVLVISHHPIDLFSAHADVIYALAPSRTSGVTLTAIKNDAPPQPEDNGKGNDEDASGGRGE